MSDPIEQTRRWLERVVIGLGLCPFAATPYRAGRVAFRTTRARDPDGIYREFLAALMAMLDAGEAEQETLLFIVPDALAGFDDYLGMLATLEDAVDEVGLAGVIQIASFHPDYRFDGAPAEDPANYSNRSPFPMFHLIREASLSAALAGYADPEAIPARNIRRLRELGAAAIEALIRDDRDGGPQSRS